MNSRKQLISIYFSYKSDIFFFACGILMFCSEIWKQFTLTFAIGGGSYIWWYFPFQLCSIPMYILLAYPWLRGSSARKNSSYVSYVLLPAWRNCRLRRYLRSALPAESTHRPLISVAYSSYYIGDHGRDHIHPTAPVQMKKKALFSPHS